jgi:hypothetical protein
MPGADGSHGGNTVRALPYDRHVRMRGKARSHAAPRERLVVDDEDP